MRVALRNFIKNYFFFDFSIKEKHEVLTLSGHPIKNDTPLEDRKNATIYLVDKVSNKIILLDIYIY